MRRGPLTSLAVCVFIVLLWLLGSLLIGVVSTMPQGLQMPVTPIPGPAPSGDTGWGPLPGLWWAPPGLAKVPLGSLALSSLSSRCSGRWLRGGGQGQVACGLSSDPPWKTTLLLGNPGVGVAWEPPARELPSRLHRPPRCRGLTQRRSKHLSSQTAAFAQDLAQGSSRQ